HMRSFMHEHHYHAIDGVSINEMSELSGMPSAFDFVIANSLFASLPFNSVARCIASVVRKLTTSGRFYATWFDNPSPADFDPIVRSSGVTTYSDRGPYHYPLALIAQVCDSVGAAIECVGTSGHPRGESIMCITRRG